MKVSYRWAVVALAAGVAGCVAVPPPLPQQQQPFVAVPGPGKTEAVFHQDDAFCRNASTMPYGAIANGAAAGASQQSQPAPVAGTPPGAEAVPPGAIYLQCMESRNNVIQQLTPSAPQLYGYIPAYPIYPGFGYSYGYPWFYGYPWAYGGFGFGFGFYGGGFRGGYGYGGYRGYGGYGGFRGGYGGGFEGRAGGFEGGGFRGGGGGFGRR